jgi:hypothetical protein
MLELKVLGIVDSNDNSTEDNNSIKQISLRKEFEWFLSEEFRSLREEFKPTDNSESLDEKGVKEILPLSNQENFSLGSSDEQKKKEDGTTIDNNNNNNNANNTSLYFECYYCQFKTDIKLDYERHVVQAHPKKQCYPGKAELDRLGIGGKRKSWEI